MNTNLHRLSILLIVLEFMACGAPAVKKSRKPNILFILVDDLGYNDVGFMGSTYYETPNLDRLASMATVFTCGYANSAVCSPSRASILTGQFTARTGVTDWIGAAVGSDWRENGRHDRLLPPAYGMHLPTVDNTLPAQLKRNGYVTFMAGKWHLGGDVHRPEVYGFDINKGGYHSGSPQGGYFAPYNNPKLADGLSGENLTLRLADETSKFITQHKDSTFFAYLSFYAVHGPVQTTNEKWKKYREKAVKQGVSEQGFNVGDVLPYRLHQDNPVYAGLVETMDEAVGRVLQTLEDEGLLDNTIIVFTSDNGGVVSGDNFSTNLAPLKGGKGTEWEGGVRVPLLIKATGYGGQRTVDDPVIGSDLFPTLLDLAGIPLLPDGHRDGVSLRPLLGGDTLAKRSLIWHYPHYGNQGGRPNSAIRRGPWKLIHDYETGENSLYNLHEDIAELENQADEYPQRTEKLYTELMDYLQTVGAKFPVADPQFNAQQRQQWERQTQTRLLERLTQERQAMLQEGYQPNADWWGSQPRD